MSFNPGDDTPNTDKGQEERPVERTRETREDRPSRESQSRRPTASLKDLNRLLGGPLSRDTGGETLVAALAGFKGWIDSDKNVSGRQTVDLKEVQLLPMEAAEHNVLASAVIFTYPIEHDGAKKVLSFIVVLEGSIDGEMPAKTYDMGRRSYSIPSVVGDFVTDGYLQAATAIVRKAYSNDRRQPEVIDAGWRSVSKLVDFSMKDNEQVRKIAFHAMTAITAVTMELLSPDVYFGLDMLAKGENLVLNTDVSGRETFTADGLPRKTDMTVNVQGHIQLEDTTSKRTLATIGGRIDLIYAPDPEANLSRHRREEPPLVPIFVINHMDTGLNAVTPELIGLGLAGVSSLSRGREWARVFLPNDLGTKNDYRDTGWLALFSSEKRYQDLGNLRSLDPEDWAEYFFSLVSDELAWGIEVEEGGDNSWLTSLFWAAANGDTDAEDRLIGYFDRLTNSHFSSRMREAGIRSVVRNSGQRYLTGVYKDEGDNLRSTADFDLLRWLHHTGAEGTDIALDWQETFEPESRDWEVRTSEQVSMLASVLNQNLTLVRYVNLVYLDTGAMKALALAVTDCGVGIDQSNSMYQFGNRRLRGNMRIRDLADGDITGGLFNRPREVNGGRRSVGPLGNGLGRGYHR